MIRPNPKENYMVVTVYDDYEEGVITFEDLEKAQADFARQSKEGYGVYLCQILNQTAV